MLPGRQLCGGGHPITPAGRRAGLRRCSSSIPGLATLSTKLSGSGQGASSRAQTGGSSLCGGGNPPQLAAASGRWPAQRMANGLGFQRQGSRELEYAGVRQQEGYGWRGAGQPTGPPWPWSVTPTGCSWPGGGRLPNSAVGGCRTRQCAGAQQRLGALHVAGRSMGSGVSAVGDFRPRIRGAPVVTMGLHGRKRLRGKDSRFGSISPRLRQPWLLKSSTALAKAV
jgi:hypothetical protein